MKSFARVLALIVAIWTPASGNAAVLVCPSSTVTEVMVAPGGSVFPTFQGIGTPNMCSLSGSVVPPSVGTITADVCRGWLSMFITAKITNVPVLIKIDYGAATPPTNCNNLFNYNQPNPFPTYVSLAP
jgi:hypothetical protein